MRVRVRVRVRVRLRVRVRVRVRVRHRARVRVTARVRATRHGVQRLVPGRAAHEHPVALRVAVPLQQLVGEAAVVSQQQQALAVAVEPADVVHA